MQKNFNFNWILPEILRFPKFLHLPKRYLGQKTAAELFFMPKIQMTNQGLVIILNIDGNRSRQIEEIPFNSGSLCNRLALRVISTYICIYGIISYSPAILKLTSISAGTFDFSLLCRMFLPMTSMRQDRVAERLTYFPLQRMAGVGNR